MAGVEWSARRTSRSAVHHQDERTRPHGRGEHSERIVLMSIDGGKPPLGLSFALDSPPLIIPVPSRRVAADKMARADRREFMHVTLRTLPVMSATTAIRVARSDANGCQRSDARCIDHHEADAAARQAPWASRNFRRPPRPRTCVPRDNLRTTIGLLSQENRCRTDGQSPSGDPGLLWTSKVYMNYRVHV